MLWLMGFVMTAIVAVSIIALLTLLDLFSPPSAAAVQKALTIFGGWVAQALGWILLVPLFFVVGPLSRVFTRVMGADPLGRRIRRAGWCPSWDFASPECSG